MRTKHFLIAALVCLAGAASAFAQSSTPPPPTPPPPTAKQPPSRVAKGGDVEMAYLISKVPPVYPKAAIDARVQGTVKLHTVIDKDGTVLEATYVSGPAMLVQASIDAVKQWRFRPTLLAGVPVQVECVFEVNFHLGK